MKKILLGLMVLAAPAFGDIGVSPGVGKTVHTDTVGGVEYQAIKIMDGTTGGTSSATVSTIGLRVDLTTTTVVASTVGINGVVPVSIAASTSAVLVINAPTVVQSTAGFNGSTIAVTNAVGTTLAISGNLTGNQNVTVLASTVGIAGTVPTTVSNSTTAVVFNGTQNVTVLASTVGIAGTLPTTVSNSTIAVVFPSAQNVTVLSSTVGINGTLPVSIAGSTMATVGILSNNGQAAGTNMIPNLVSIAQLEYANNGTAYTQGRNAALNIGINDGLLRTSNLPNQTDESYSASTVSFAVAYSSIDFTGICGNIISTVTITGLRISCTQTTAGMVPLAITRRSAAYTGVWSTVTAAGDDPSYAINDSSAIIFVTASPGNPETNGTFVNYLSNYMINCPATTGSSANDVYINPANWRMKSIILRSPNQCIGVNTQSAVLTGTKFTVEWDWMEGNTP
jgi:hypothetical protein